MHYEVRYFLVFDPIGNRFAVFDSNGPRMVMSGTDPIVLVTAMAALESENLHSLTPTEKVN